MRNKIIKTVLFFSFVLSLSAYGINKDWRLALTSFPPIRTTFHSMIFADSINGIIWQNLSGDWGYRFLKSTNGGNNWQSIYYDSSYYKSGSDYKFIPYLQDIAYPTPNFFIAVGDSGTIIRTTNGGFTWQKIPFVKNKIIYKIRMLDDKYGIFLAGSYDYNNPGGKIYATYDGGLNWILLNSPPLFDHAYFDDYQIIKKDLFYASVRPNGKQPYLLKVSGNWDNWSMDSLKYMFLHMYFLNENEGWLASGNLLDANGTCSQTIYYTSDGGTHWENQRDSNYNSAPINAISFVNKNYGMAVSGLGCILTTTNGGRKWKESLITEPPYNQSYTLRQLQLLSEKNALVFSNHDELYKYSRDTNLPQNHAPEKPDKPIGNSPDSVYLSYSYSTKTSDPDGDSVKYYFDWGDGKLSEWTQLNATGEKTFATHIWDTTGFFRIRVKARDKEDMESDWSDYILVHVIGDITPANHPPDIPSKPEGSLTDSIYKNYEYKTKTNDNDGDSISYYFDWGDSSQTDWTVFYSSGIQTIQSHSWNDTGNYVIKVRAKDSKGALSDWSDTLGIKVIEKFSGIDNTILFSENQLLLSPNPVSDYLTITIADNGIALNEIKIIDLYGRLVFCYSVESDVLKILKQGYLKIYFSNFEPGVYFVKSGNTVKKFIKI